MLVLFLAGCLADLPRLAAARVQSSCFFVPSLRLFSAPESDDETDDCLVLEPLTDAADCSTTACGGVRYMFMYTLDLPVQSGA